MITRDVYRHERNSTEFPFRLVSPRIVELPLVVSAPFDVIVNVIASLSGGSCIEGVMS
jgi:hypothetical protein